jgi:hypothetical protein
MPCALQSCHRSCSKGSYWCRDSRTDKGLKLKISLSHRCSRKALIAEKATDPLSLGETKSLKIKFPISIKRKILKLSCQLKEYKLQTGYSSFGQGRATLCGHWPHFIWKDYLTQFYFRPQWRNRNRLNYYWCQACL